MLISWTCNYFNGIFCQIQHTSWRLMVDLSKSNFCSSSLTFNSEASFSCLVSSLSSSLIRWLSLVIYREYYREENTCMYIYMYMYCMYVWSMNQINDLISTKYCTTSNLSQQMDKFNCIEWIYMYTISHQLYCTCIFILTVFWWVSLTHMYSTLCASETINFLLLTDLVFKRLFILFEFFYFEISLAQLMLDIAQLWYAVTLLGKELFHFILLLFKTWLKIRFLSLKLRHVRLNLYNSNNRKWWSIEVQVLNRITCKVNLLLIFTILIHTCSYNDDLTHYKSHV